ncbi:BURP domain-containing protein 3-like [Prosopis cineraria]|uniref:BURP domain-containing protein 3-like n=1 Tax=Prosopis cineraria TaxID=364024 RepID=UPI00240FDBB8|nr:BURP domain-containing protein 3-like [Prosopis cineraria]
MMKFPLRPIVAFLVVALLVATHAALSPELYWKSMLPTTPMPRFIADLLHPAGYGTTVHRRVDRQAYCANEYCYADSETKLHNNPNTALFFLEKDLKVGHKMNLLFTQASNQASFLPRGVVKSIPFSSSKARYVVSDSFYHVCEH